ncbi:MAG TPA: hypothetical protein VNG13_04745 [Mycobacteriales bacterium]|nr:hypothetical protein [Mycobacteriales bacterium]
MNPVYVHGTAVHKSWADESASLSDLIYRATQDALTAAATDIDQIDSVVLSAHDLVDGRSLSSMVTAPAAGAYLKDEVRLGDDGAMAFVVGAARIRCGESRRSLIAAYGRASEGDQDRISNALFDPFFMRPLALTELSVAALRAGSALGNYAEYSMWRDRASSLRVAQAGGQPGARSAAPYPLLDGELPTWCDLVAVAVLSADPAPVRLRGVGMSTEPYQIGDRDLLALPALRRASRQAFEAGELTIEDVDVLEVDGLTLFDEALALEAVGAAATGAGMRALAERRDVNPDGGFAAGYCAPAMGLVRICSAATRLMSSGAVALATGSSVVAAQSQTAVVLASA